MRIFKDLKEWRDFRKTLGSARVGFVPTMGALHEGHASLLRRAHQENDHVVLSIYVNATQFNNKEDLAKYPITLETDIAMADREGVDSVILPTYADMYPDDYQYRVSESDFSKELCGAHRPGHFDGVLTVVLKLLNLVNPARAYFGEKDFQQLELVRGMVKAFFVDTEIIGCPIIREESGLALSSRNQRLSEHGKRKATLISKIVGSKGSADKAKFELELAGFDVDYVEDRGSRRFIAASIEGVRLIDNGERTL